MGWKVKVYERKDDEVESLEQCLSYRDFSSF